MATHSSVLAWRIPGRGEPGMQPRDPCLPWRGILGPGHTDQPPDQRLSASWSVPAQPGDLCLLSRVISACSAQ